MSVNPVGPREVHTLERNRKLITISATSSEKAFEAKEIKTKERSVVYTDDQKRSITIGKVGVG